MFRRIFQTTNLFLLWLAEMASQSADSIYQIGLLWITLELTGSESTTGLVAMASYLPAVIFSLVAGLVADHANRRKVMAAASATRALLVLLVPLVAFAGVLSPVFLGVNAFALAIAATFFNPARDAIVPQIVPGEGLVKANSLIQTSWQFSMLLGPGIAGWVLYYFGKMPLFWAAAGTYAASFVGIMLMRLSAGQSLLPTDRTTSPTPPSIEGGDSAPITVASQSPSLLTSQSPPSIGASYSPPSIEEGVGEVVVRRRIAWSDILRGLRFAARDPILGPLLLITIADNIFIMGPAIVGTPVFVKQNLGLDADSFAIVEACYAIGMLLGTGMLLTIGKNWPKGKVLLVGIVLDGLTFVPIYWVNSLFALEATIVIHSVAIPMLTVSRASLIQSIVPRGMSGQIFALVNLAVVGMSAISSGLAGLALEAVGARILFLWIGLGGGLCGVAGLIWASALKSSK